TSLLVAFSIFNSRCKSATAFSSSDMEPMGIFLFGGNQPSPRDRVRQCPTTDGLNAYLNQG
ncbi:hypothetical protein M8U74_24140, partial [Enterobacter hormaechei]|uniref:hypothetical protein n=1 Tax=Enterobacter hormaechei TaxID=158836 RepID=UPI001F29E61D